MNFYVTIRIRKKYKRKYFCLILMEKIASLVERVIAQIYFKNWRFLYFSRKKSLYLKIPIEFHDNLIFRHLREKSTD